MRGAAQLLSSCPLVRSAGRPEGAVPRPAQRTVRRGAHAPTGLRIPVSPPLTCGRKVPERSERIPKPCSPPERGVPRKKSEENLDPMATPRVTRESYYTYGPARAGRRAVHLPPPGRSPLQGSSRAPGARNPTSPPPGTHGPTPVPGTDTRTPGPTGDRWNQGFVRVRPRRGPPWLRAACRRGRSRPPHGAAAHGPRGPAPRPSPIRLGSVSGTSASLRPVFGRPEHGSRVAAGPVAPTAGSLVPPVARHHPNRRLRRGSPAETRLRHHRNPVGARHRKPRPVRETDPRPRSAAAAGGPPPGR